MVFDKKAYLKQYYQDNKEKLKKQNKKGQAKYRGKNRDKCNLATKNWRNNNSEKRRNYGKEYRDKITFLKWQLVFKFLGDKCFNCGLKTEFVAVYDIHHLDNSIKEKGNNNKSRKTLKKFEKWITENKDKLRLLCANCHRIEHHRNLTI